jgi:6-phosphogluconolactonase
MTGRLVVHRFDDEPALAIGAAQDFAARAAVAVGARGAFHVAFTGGSTPREAYALLATDAWRPRVPWARTHVFFGDERCVPPDHPDSNYGMARDALLAHVAPASVHRLEGERDPADAAARADADLRAALGAQARLDLVHLGLGEDGHVASLFPGTPAVEERDRWVVAQHVPKLGAHRLTMTFPVFDRAVAVVFLVAGAQKAPALAALLSGGDVPASRVRSAAGELVVLADRAALGERP